MAYRLRIASYDQPQKGDDPAAAVRRLRTYRQGDLIESLSDEERDRLLSLNAIEETPKGSSEDDSQRQIEERREAAQQEQRDAAEGLSGGDSREDLQREAEALGLPKSGSKAELRERIDAHRQSQE